MISSSNNNNRSSQRTKYNKKKEIFYQKQVKKLPQSPCNTRNKIKSRQQPQIFQKKQESKGINIVIKNLIQKQHSQNSELSFFSQKDKEKVKINIKKSDQHNLKVNSNGFSTFPPPITQLLPPLLIISMILEMVLVSLEFKNEKETFIALGIMGFLFVLVAYFWYRTSSICPTDEIQIKHLEYIKYPQKFTFEVQKYKFFCNLCRTCVNRESFHCNKCNRCVQHFDHHCKWINNCIGSKNYIQFIQLIVSGWLFMVLFYIWNAILICKLVNENDQLPQILWFAVSMLIIVLIPFVALSMLLALHSYLIIVKKSTLNFIFQNKNKNKNQAKISTLSLVRKKTQNIYLPDQSPANSPPNPISDFIFPQITQQKSDKMLKFMKNLTNNLNINKLKVNEQQKDQNLFSQDKQKQVTFQSKILQKNTSKNKEQTKEKSVKIDESQYKLQQQKSSHIALRQHRTKQNKLFSEVSQIDDSAKNIISHLEFLPKQQIPSQLPKTKKEQQIIQDKQKYFTPRARLQKSQNSERLSPLKQSLTERKIKQNSFIKNFDPNIQKLKKEEIQTQHEYQNPSNKENVLETHSTKSQDTRLFLVISSSNNTQKSKNNFFQK